MTDEDVNKLRTVIKEEVTSVVKEEINTGLEPVHQKLDALTADVMELQDTANLPSGL